MHVKPDSTLAPCPNCPKSKPPVAAWRRTSKAAASSTSRCAAPTCAGRSRPRSASVLPGQRIDAVRRRAKYLLLDTAAGSALLHLGMSGSLRVLPAEHAGARARPRRPRRSTPARCCASTIRAASAACCGSRPGETHELLAGLGPEPLSDDFDGDYLFARSRGRSAPVKTFLMDQRVVVGVGNIYVAEALFAAGVVAAARGRARSRASATQLLADAVKRILGHAIERGGTTLRDFISPDGAPGYFEQELSAYGRGGEPCPRCGRPLKQAAIGQRATVWCGHCQR